MANARKSTRDSLSNLVMFPPSDDESELYPQGDDSSPPPLCGLIFFEGDRCLCLTLKFVERLKCYSAKPNESCIIFGIYYFISCLISIVILSLCIFLFLLSFLVRYRVKTMQEKEKMCQTVA
jgi:hypothetical protein